jgi:hypothetical protein
MQTHQMGISLRQCLHQPVRFGLCYLLRRALRSLPPVDYNTNCMSLVSLLLIYDDAKTTFLNMCCTNIVFTFD